MDKEKEKIDDLIKEALSAEEAAFYDQLDEQNVLQEFGGLLKGKNAWLTVMTTVVIFIFMGVMVYSFIQFFESEDVKELLFYAIILVFSFQAVGLLKMWNYMQMDRKAVIREIKRLELQMTALVQKKSA